MNLRNFSTTMPFVFISWIDDKGFSTVGGWWRRSCTCCVLRQDKGDVRGKIDGEKSHSSGDGLWLFCWGSGFLPDKQAITGDYYEDYCDDLPALQVEQVKRGCFEAIYEDNAWKFKLNSNDQNGKNVVEILFLWGSRNAVEGEIYPIPTSHRQRSQAHSADSRSVFTTRQFWSIEGKVEGSQSLPYGRKTHKTVKVVVS